MVGYFSIEYRQTDSRTSGFTLVELLIVIVVIALLAVISIVAYNGVTQRAQNSSAYETIRNYAQAFKMIDTDGTLPSANACLGPASAYPSGCAIGGQNATTQPSTNTLLTNEGMTNQPTMPFSSAPTLMYATPYYSAQAVLLYYMPGPSTNCGVQPVMSPNGSGVWGFYGATTSMTGIGPGNAYTFCVIGIKF